MKEKHRLIVYDIRDTKRLAKVSKCIESYAWRVQKSVFESFTTDETTEQLKRKLKKIIDEEEDFILFFELCERDFQKKQVLGKQEKQTGSRKIIDEQFAIL